jgi:dTDP-4-amino-4,6-dideoxygalactose transaminase
MNENMIPFNKPFFTGNETNYIEQAVRNGKISGNGLFTQKCHAFFEKKFGFKKCFLTTSCTDALEMAAILCNIKPGDEVIIPSYTFVSTANAFILRGANIVFADSRSDHPGIDERKIETLITHRTKVIVPVHYAGFACDMDIIMDIANRHNLLVVEDAAQAINSFYNERTLGGIGHLGCFSFHETKNIQCGEGGMLAINDDRFTKRAEIIWEKGTNRAELFRGEVNKYGWVDIGSSFLPSEITAAFLWAQIENMDLIQQKRYKIWNLYMAGLKDWAHHNHIQLPFISDYASNNGHMFYLVCKSASQQQYLLKTLKENGFLAVFHYLSLHKSPFFKDKYIGADLPQSNRYSDCLIRLPLFYELEDENIEKIIKIITEA